MTLAAAETPSPFGGPRHPDPCNVVIFGATGDLTHRKLMPALYDLESHGILPCGLTIVGYGRKPLDDESFRALLRKAIDDHYGASVRDSVCDSVLETPRWVHGEFDDPEGYRRLAEFLSELDRQNGCGNRLFYLATPPDQFPVIVRQLAASGLSRRGASDDQHACGDPVPGWTRIVVEKPFGSDLESAAELDREINEAFSERQVYRIDHYLAKETVQNLLVLRFANGIFEPVWNRRFIDHVQITAFETIGIGDRGPYYDNAGALRDMLTPHLIQLFTLVAMEPPVAFDADSVRDEKLKVLRSVKQLDRGRLGEYAVRGQYAHGMIDGKVAVAYRAEKGIPADSHTETFAALKLMVENWRWQGVPFYLRTGKRMAKQFTEIVIQFKRPPVQIFRDAGAAEGLEPNLLVLRVQPEEGFALHIESKVPGHGMELQPVAMEYSYGGTLYELPFRAYETVLVDVMEGDMTLFTRADQAEEAWRVVEPVLEEWGRQTDAPIPMYAAGSWGPEAADALIATDGRVWRRPPGTHPAAQVRRQP